MDHLRILHDAPQHPKHRFKHVPGPLAGGPTFETLALEKMLHGQVEQALLVFEEFVERALRNPQLLRNVVHTHRLDALRDEHLHGLGYDPFLLIHDPESLVSSQI